MLLPAPKSEYIEESGWRIVGQALLRSCDEGGVPGFDTETIGCDPFEESPINTANVVLWSVGIPGPKTGPLHPRGYRPTKGIVLPPAALEETHIRRWLESYPKVAHNVRYDLHTLANEGVTVGGDIFDTVDIYRVVSPGLESYRLKDLIPTFCGYETLGKYKEIFRRHKVSERDVRQHKKVCTVDGDQPNKFRKCPVCKEELVVVEWTEIVRKELVSWEEISLQEVCQIPVLQTREHLDIRPNWHELWPVLVQYAGLDAVAASDLYQIADHLPGGVRKAKVPEWHISMATPVTSSPPASSVTVTGSADPVGW